MNPIRRCAVHVLQSGFVEHFLSVGETPAVGWLIGPERSHSFKPLRMMRIHYHTIFKCSEWSRPAEARETAPLLPKEITIPSQISTFSVPHVAVVKTTGLITTGRDDRPQLR